MGVKELIVFYTTSEDKKVMFYIIDRRNIPKVYVLMAIVEIFKNLFKQSVIVNFLKAFYNKLRD